MKLIDVSVNAGRKRQSPQTGFIHILDTIPLFENFCFAFALFRQKTGDSVVEGKKLIKRLLAFQTPFGNFPRSIHEFPLCLDTDLSLKVAPILMHIEKEFSAVLDSNYKEMLHFALKKMIKPPQSPRFEHRYLALCGKRPILKEKLTDASKTFELVVSDQLFEKGATYPIPFNQVLQAFTGSHLVQEKNEPEAVAIEYVLGESPRLQKDHINQLYAACLYPFSTSLQESTPFSWSEGGALLWKGTSLHSLVAPKAIKDKDGFLFHLEDEIVESRDDLIGACVFCDLSDETTVLINEQKGTVFYLSDTVSILTPTQRIDLQFNAEGPGEFCGHISRGNRPGQIALNGEDTYAAYDFKIALRTLKRSGPCTIRCHVLVH